MSDRSDIVGFRDGSPIRRHPESTSGNEDGELRTVRDVMFRLRLMKSLNLVNDDTPVLTMTADRVDLYVSEDGTLRVVEARD